MNSLLDIYSDCRTIKMDSTLRTDCILNSVTPSTVGNTVACYRLYYYSACRRRGGVLKCPRFWVFFGVESWCSAHGWYRCTVYRLLSEPMSTRLLNSISSRICRQNTQFNVYTTTSKQQEGCTFKDSHPKCFITTNFDKFHREAFARAVNRGDVLTACFRDIQSQRSIRMAFVIIMILFDVKDYRLLYGSISLSSEKIYTWQSRFLQMFINWCFWY